MCKIEINKTKIEKLYIYIVFMITLFMITYVEYSDYLETTAIYSKGSILVLFVFIITYIIKALSNNSKLNSNYKVNTSMIIIFFLLNLSLLLSNLYLLNFNVFISSIAIIVVTLVFTTVPILVIITNNYDEEEYLLLLGNITVWFAFISSIFAIWIFYIGPINIFGLKYIQLEGYFRMHGWYGNPNRFGAILGIALIFQMYISLCSENKIKSPIFIMKTGLIGITLLSVGSRGSIVAFIFAFIFFILISTYKKNLKDNIIETIILLVFKSTKRILKYSIFFLFVFILYTYLDKSFYDTIGSVFMKKGLTLTGREEIWSSWRSIYNFNSFTSMIFGHGNGYFRKSIGLSTHNGYLKWFIEYGILFITIFFIMIIGIIYNIFSRHNINKKYNIIGAIVVFCLIRDMSTPSLFSLRYEYFYFLNVVVLLFLSKKNYKD